MTQEYADALAKYEAALADYRSVFRVPDDGILIPRDKHEYGEASASWDAVFDLWVIVAKLAQQEGNTTDGNKVADATKGPDQVRAGL